MNLARVEAASNTEYTAREIPVNTLEGYYHTVVNMTAGFTNGLLHDLNLKDCLFLRFAVSIK